jgi:hypothetical protein
LCGVHRSSIETKIIDLSRNRKQEKKKKKWSDEAHSPTGSLRDEATP